MGRPYEFADESLYRMENLTEVIKGGKQVSEETEDPEVLVHVEHMVRHALWEYKQRREEEIQATAGRIVITEANE